MMKSYLISSYRLRNKDGGFSLIDVVVTVAIVVALSTGGFLSYTVLIENAKKGATESTATEVYAAAILVESSDWKNTGGTIAQRLKSLENGHNESSGPGGIQVKITPDNPATVQNELSVTATHSDGQTATRGYQP